MNVDKKGAIRQLSEGGECTRDVVFLCRSQEFVGFSQAVSLASVILRSFMPFDNLAETSDSGTRRPTWPVSRHAHEFRAKHNSAVRKPGADIFTRSGGLSQAQPLRLVALARTPQ